MTRYQLYDMIHWRIVSQRGQDIEFRPSTRTVSRRLVWTFVSLILMVLIHLGFGRARATQSGHSEDAARPTPSPELQKMAAELEVNLRQQLSQAEWQEFEAERDAASRTRAERRAEFDAASAALGSVGRAAYWVAMLTLGITGLYGPIAAQFQRIRIGRDARRNLDIRSRSLVPQRHRWPAGTFEFIATRAEQQVRRPRRGAYRAAGWRWQVALVPREGIDALVEFWIDYETERIPSDTTVPDGVVNFVSALKQITGLPAREPTFVAFEGARPGLFRTGLKFSRRGGGPGNVVTSRATYGSLDDMPPEVRARAEALLSKAQADASGNAWSSGTYTASSYSVTGPDGVTRTYDSLEEMPPEVRTRIEQSIRESSK